jgi:hypothetical protein
MRVDQARKVSWFGPARRLERPWSERRQLEARLQRQAALVGAREATKEAAERAGGPVSIGDLLDASYPPLPLSGEKDVGAAEPAPRHWDEPGRERDVGRD